MSEMSEMSVSDFLILHDDDGIRYVTKRDQLTKNHRENNDEKTGGYMYEVLNSERCPIQSFEKYVAKLHPACEWLWQKPKKTVPQNESEQWYCNSPVGINTLSNKMKQISTAAGCSKIYNSQSLNDTSLSVYIVYSVYRVNLYFRGLSCSTSSSAFIILLFLHGVRVHIICFN